MLTAKLTVLFLLVTFGNVFGAKDPVKFFRHGFTNFRLADTVEKSLGLKVICHGLKSSSKAYWYQPMIKGFLKKNLSVIAVDWRDFADDGYIDAVAAAEDVAEELAEELLKVKKKFNVPLSKMHIVGHSLGAHIAGYTGKTIFNSTGERIGRITGLDPAGPGFSLALGNSLSREHALFVDVIHTDTDLLGINLSLGHADFYPNGGALQNKCDVVDVGCSHRVAPEYFIESIATDSFVAKRCNSYLWYVWGFCNNNERAIMGLECDSNSRGDYYLTTNSHSPYGKGS